jgi:hypothetical protein
MYRSSAVRNPLRTRPPLGCIGMNQVRFQIGVPRAGSAAHRAEQEDLGTNPGRLVRPVAGSAAKAAEDEKAANGRTAQTGAGFSLRGQNGTVVRNAAVTPAALNHRAGVQTPPVEALAQPARPASQQASETLPSNPRGSNAESPLAGPLQLAASRFQTLVQSLFSPGDKTGKP